MRAPCPLRFAFSVGVVGVGASIVPVSMVAISGRTVILTLSAAVTSVDTVTMAYLTLSGNRIRDAAGNEAAPLSSQAVTNNTPAADTTPPMLTGAAVNGNMLTLTYDEELDDTSVPNPLADPPPFELGGTSETVSMVAISGMTVTLTLSAALTSNNGVTVSYTAPGMNPVQDTAGNDAGSFTDVSLDDTLPMLVRTGE